MWLARYDGHADAISAVARWAWALNGRCLRPTPEPPCLLPTFLRCPLSLLIAAALAAAPMRRMPIRRRRPATSANLAASTLDAVVVTGSRTSTRTVKNSSTPIDVISAEDLAATGQANLLEALQRSLPSLSQIGGYQRQTHEESLIRGYQQRNLSPGYTLVLVNGKRRNASAYVSGANGGGYPGHDLGRSGADSGIGHRPRRGAA